MFKQNSILYISAFLIAGTLMACRSSSSMKTTNNNQDTSKPDPVAVDTSSPGTPDPAEQPSVPLDELVKGNNAFAMDLYRALAKGDTSVFLSPYSISTALAMTYAGARDNTAKQMASALHFAPGNVHGAFAGLTQTITPQIDAGYELHVANALWAMKGYEFRPEFVDMVRTAYKADLQTVDFGDEPAARKAINAWVENATRGKIKDLIPSGLLDAMTRLVLTNAIYFKGTWAQKFDANATKDAPFTLLGGNSVNVPMMYRKAAVSYAETEDAHVVELPYKGDTLTMVVAVPKAKNGLPALEARLDAGMLASMTQELRSKEIALYLPRFKIEAQFGLSPVLQSLGMTDAFSDSADFSGMNSGKEDLYIKAVLHKAFVEVNEEGTEAAAATAVVVTARGAPRPPLEVRADHPFFFMIRHKSTGAILFMGRMTNPSR